MTIIIIMTTITRVSFFFPPRVNLEKLNGEGTIVLPNLFVNCTYDVDGRLLVVPLQGQGLFVGNISESRFNGSLEIFL